MNARSLLLRRTAVLALAGLALPAFANVPLADREADRQAKAAAPGAGEVLVYVYRPDDSNNAALTVTLSGRDPVRLAPRTFAWWRVKPGRVNVSVERSASVLTITGQPGRVYYVEVARGKSGVPVLRSVSFATGRTQVHRSQLVAQSASRRVPAPKQKTAAPAQHVGTRGAVMFKLGSISLDTGSVPLAGEIRHFDSSAFVWGLEGEWLLRPDISLGLELLKYSSDFTSASGGGSADITVGLFNIKRYFLPDSAWQPYIGAGLGSVLAQYSGALTGSTSGLALQAVGGVQWRRGQFTLRGEFKYLSASTEEDSGQEVDFSGTGFYLGAGFYF